VGRFLQKISDLLKADAGSVVEVSVDLFLSLRGLPGAAERAAQQSAPSEPFDRKDPNVAVVIVGRKAHVLHGFRRQAHWRDHVKERPEFLFAAVHRVENKDLAFSLLDRTERQKLLDTSFDQITAGYRKHKLELNSHRLKDGRLAVPLYLAFRGAYPFEEDGPFDQPINLTKAVGVVADELRFLDKTGCPKEVFTSGVLAAAILGLAIDDKAKSFVTRLAEGKGNKIDGMKDPVEALLTLTSWCSYMNRAETNKFQPELFRRSLRCLEGWLGEKDPEVTLASPMIARRKFWISGKARDIDPDPIIQRFRTVKNVEGVPDL